MCPPEASCELIDLCEAADQRAVLAGKAVDCHTQSHRADGRPMRRAKTLGMGLVNIDEQLHVLVLSSDVRSRIEQNADSSGQSTT